MVGNEGILCTFGVWGGGNIGQEIVKVNWKWRYLVRMKVRARDRDLDLVRPSPRRNCWMVHGGTCKKKSQKWPSPSEVEGWRVLWGSGPLITGCMKKEDEEQHLPIQSSIWLELKACNFLKIQLYIYKYCNFLNPQNQGQLTHWL